MAVVEIIDVSVPDLDRRQLWAATVDSPTKGSAIDAYAVKLAGWVLARRAPAVAVEVVRDNRVIRFMPTYALRAREGAPELSSTERPPARIGFWGAVGVLGWPSEFELHLRAVLQDDSRVPFAVIRGRHQTICSGFTPKLNPLMVTAMDRSGTTWLMRVLAEHPRIVALRRYPYEFRPARYWMHMLKVVSAPSDYVFSSDPDNFPLDLERAGHNPYNTEFVDGHPSLKSWFGKTHVEQLATFCQRTIDECYLHVANDQKEDGPLYFAEKHPPDQIAWLMRDLYPQACEIFLVRDFRDMFCSMIAFNAKRGTPAFGRDLVSNDYDFVEICREKILRLYHCWKKRSNRSYFLRYEDLIQQPAETIASLCKYLNLDSIEPDIEELVRRAEMESSDLARHRTTPSPAESIGRWRRDLDGRMRERCQDAFADMLTAFGYHDS